MNSARDPFEMLAAMVPDRDERPLAVGEDPRAERLLQTVLGDQQSGAGGKKAPALRRGRRKWWAGLALVPIVGVGAVAAAAWLRRPADATTLVCYSNAEVNPRIRSGLTIDPDLTPQQQCGPLWRDGTLGSGGPPDLVACVTGFEATAVMPGDDTTCNELGLAIADAPSGGDDLDAQVAAAVPDLFEVCVTDLEEIQNRVEQLLAELGASEWSVRVDGTITPDRPCAANVINGVDHEVVIVTFQPPD